MKTTPLTLYILNCFIAVYMNHDLDAVQQNEAASEALEKELGKGLGSATVANLFTFLGFGFLICKIELNT